MDAGAGEKAKLTPGNPTPHRSCQAAKGLRLCRTHSQENQKRGAECVTRQDPGTLKAICFPWKTQMRLKDSSREMLLVSWPWL